jgi:hypothetical protein
MKLLSAKATTRAVSPVLDAVARVVAKTGCAYGPASKLTAVEIVKRLRIANAILK